MASIFTFDPDPPRLSSPWLAARQVESSLLPVAKWDENTPFRASDAPTTNFSVTRLDAEPQEGPIEYKLHLLLRPRRRLLSSTTRVWHVGQQNIQPTDMTARQVQWPQYSGSRQHRLEQLTTQLLWRLQQSSPYHSSSSDNLILPALPEATAALQAPHQLSKLLPGLEESKGALYEIGVADNGSLVGLTEDELNESLNNLRAMAASIGCDVRVLRNVEVGICEYEEDEEDGNGTPVACKRKGTLFVAEAYVKPILDSRDLISSHTDKRPTSEDVIEAAARTSEPASTMSSSNEQLRISLTGATTSGKSSLLGTLSTSTLDNGRGKSRLSLLKHRHEIASGMTSSVAQELIGYSDRASSSGETKVSVVNYATGNVSSWDDIHASSSSGRLAFICDSAGHPRFRRTTVRGLVGWAPHWTLMCIAADTSADVTVQESPTLAAGDDMSASATIANVAMAHLDLCLKLELPLIVIITKFDVATKQVRQVLSDVLTRLKNAGRMPLMLPNGPGTADESELQSITKADEDEIIKACRTVSVNERNYVPVLFTSAVRGVGIGKLHALLRHLPVPQPLALLSASKELNDVGSASPDTLFHIDDTFNLSSKHLNLTPSESRAFIISGHLSSGRISIGDELQLGPFSWTADTEDNTTRRRSTHHDEPFLSPRSFGEALNRTTALSRGRHADQEWVTMRVISIRNLRLPVRELHVDQAGTIGLVAATSTMQDLTIRKGMVLTSGGPDATHAFTAAFGIEEANAVFVGSIVIIYTATVRAAAKVVAVSLRDDEPCTIPNHTYTTKDSSTDHGFNFSLDEDLTAHPPALGILVTFQFLTYREYVQKGAKVLVMPGGSASGVAAMSVGEGLGQDIREKSKVAGLEGFVGTVCERFG